LTAGSILFLAEFKTDFGGRFMKSIKYNSVLMSFLLSIFFLLVSFNAAAKDMTGKDLIEEAKSAIKTISVSDANVLYGKSGVVFLDVREADEFRSGHIPGAINIPRGLLESQIEQQIPDRNTTIVVYCRSGARSALATATLLKMGYKGLLNMDGGWKAWLEAGYPAE
jgi:rhodanese-related sulfurtransferase